MVAGMVNDSADPWVVWCEMNRRIIIATTPSSSPTPWKCAAATTATLTARRLIGIQRWAAPRDSHQAEHRRPRMLNWQHCANVAFRRHFSQLRAVLPSSAPGLALWPEAPRRRAYREQRIVPVNSRQRAGQGGRSNAALRQHYSPDAAWYSRAGRYYGTRQLKRRWMDAYAGRFRGHHRPDRGQLGGAFGVLSTVSRDVHLHQQSERYGKRERHRRDDRPVFISDGARQVAAGYYAGPVCVHPYNPRSGATGSRRVYRAYATFAGRSLP